MILNVLPASGALTASLLWGAQHKGLWVYLTVTCEFICMFLLIMLFNIYEVFLLSGLLF